MVILNWFKLVWSLDFEDLISISYTLYYKLIILLLGFFLSRQLFDY
jgi:hypothetical protein